MCWGLGLVQALVRIITLKVSDQVNVWQLLGPARRHAWPGLSQFHQSTSLMNYPFKADRRQTRFFDKKIAGMCNDIMKVKSPHHHNILISRFVNQKSNHRFFCAIKNFQTFKPRQIFNFCIYTWCLLNETKRMTNTRCVKRSQEMFLLVQIFLQSLRSFIFPWFIPALIHKYLW